MHVLQSLFVKYLPELRLWVSSGSALFANINTLLVIVDCGQAFIHFAFNW